MQLWETTFRRRVLFFKTQQKAASINIIPAQMSEVLVSVQKGVLFSGWAQAWKVFPIPEVSE